MRGRRDARIDLDAELGVRRHVEPVADRLSEALQERQAGSRSACPPPQWSCTTLRPRSAPAARGDAVDLLLDEVEVGAFRDVVGPGDDDGAAAEETELFAEGKVEVEREGRGTGRRRALGEDRPVFVGAEVLLPHRRRRVGGVARALDVVAAQELERDVADAAHAVGRNGGAAAGRLEEGLDALQARAGKNPVAEVDDVGLAAASPRSLPGCALRPRPARRGGDPGRGCPGGACRGRDGGLRRGEGASRSRGRPRPSSAMASRRWAQPLT